MKKIIVNIYQSNELVQVYKVSANSLMEAKWLAVYHFTKNAFIGDSDIYVDFVNPVDKYELSGKVRFDEIGKVNGIYNIFENQLYGSADVFEDVLVIELEEK